MKNPGWVLVCVILENYKCRNLLINQNSLGKDSGD